MSELSVVTKPKPKYGGGGDLNVVVANKKPAENKSSVVSKPTANSILGVTKKTGKSNLENTDENRTQDNIKDEVADVATNNADPAVPRHFKVSIPAVFMTNTQPGKPIHSVKPQITQPASTSDSSNNNQNVHKPDNVNKFQSKNTDKSVSDTEVKSKVSNKPPLTLDINKSSETVDREEKTRVRGHLSALENKKYMEHKLVEKPESPKHLDNTPSDKTDSFNPSRKFIPGTVKAPIDNFMKAREVLRQVKPLQAFIRHSDGKRFLKVNFEDFTNCGEAPEKPAKLNEEIDFVWLIKEFKEVVLDVDASQKNFVGRAVTEVIYEDGSSTGNGRTVSLIMPMSEEEEEKWHEEGFHTNGDNGPQEEYDDVTIAVKNELSEDMELYEDEPNDNPPPIGCKPPAKPPIALLQSHKVLPESSECLPLELPTTTSKQKPKDSKEVEKERKKKEKKEKEMKKREKEMKKLFKIDSAGLAMCVAKGIVKKTAKAKNEKELAVEEGDEVDIIRMLNNPTGKWLVKVSKHNAVGYCDGENIEIDTNTIRTVMTSSRSSSSYSGSTDSSTKSGDLQQEDYEVVDENETENVPVEDEIYEECT